MSSVTEPLTQWLAQNADQVVTLDQMAEATGLDRKQVRSGLARVGKLFPNLERKTSQIFVWHAATPAPPKAGDELLLLRVIRATDKGALAIDEETDVVYVVRELQF